MAQGVMIAEQLAAVDRSAALRFMSAAINELTVHARSAYDEPEFRDRLMEANEAIHRLSGHLRDLCVAEEAMTLSRAQGIAAATGLLSDAAISRLLLHSPL